MKKKLFILWLLLLIPTISYAASNPYPKTQTFNGVVSTPCTRVAWQEAYDRLGIVLPGWGNAVDWYRNAANAGYQVGSEARPNSIAVYSGFQGYGHVAFVVSVDDETMHIVENRGDGEGKREGDRSKGIGSGEASDFYLIGFIYITEPKTVGSSSSSTSSTTTTQKSNNSNLKRLTIEGIDLEFAKDNYFYTLNVPYETSNITINGETDSSKAKVDGLKEYDLNVGENIITIKVTAEDKSESSYIINITRDEEEKENPKEENKIEIKEKQNVKKFKWSNYYLIPIIGLIILISLVTIIVIKKKKKIKK